MMAEDMSQFVIFLLYEGAVGVNSIAILQIIMTGSSILYGGYKLVCACMIKARAEVNASPEAKPHIPNLTFDGQPPNETISEA